MQEFYHQQYDHHRPQLLDPNTVERLQYPLIKEYT